MFSLFHQFAQKKGAGSCEPAPSLHGSRIRTLERKVFRAGVVGHVLNGGSRRGGPVGLSGGPGSRGGGCLGGGADGSNLPDLEVVVPAAVVLAALEVEGHLHLVADLVLVQFLHLVLTPRQEARLGGEVAVGILQDELLLLPGAPGGSSGGDGHLLDEGPFDLERHGLLPLRGFRRLLDGLDIVADLVQVHVEDEGGVGLDAAGAAVAVSEFTGDDELDLAAFADEFHALAPALDDAVEGEVDVVVLVEHGTVEQGALVVHPDGVPVGGGLLGAAGLDDLIGDAALGLESAFLLHELIDVGLALLAVQGADVGAPLLEEAVDDGVHLVGVDLELLDEFGVGRGTLRVDEVLHTFEELVIVEVAEVVSLDDGTEVYAEQVTDGVDLGLGGQESLDLLAALDGGSAASHGQRNGRRDGEKFSDLHNYKI